MSEAIRQIFDSFSESFMKDWLFSISTPLSSKPVQLENRLLDWQACCKLAKGDSGGIDLPLIFVRCSGKQWTDFLNPASVSLYVVSNRFCDVLNEASITGWKSYPVRILGPRGIEKEGYVGLSITGKSGPIDYSKSEIHEKRLVPNGPLTAHYRGLHIDMSTWDGGDMFFPEETLIPVVTKKVAELIQMYRISNVEVVSLNDYETPEIAVLKRLP